MNIAIKIPGGCDIADMVPCNLPQRAASAFTAVMEKLVGASYEPVLYAGQQIVYEPVLCAGQQIVNGVNYAIVCKQTVPYSGGAYEHLVLAVVNEKSDGEYSLVSITPIL